MFRSYKDCVRTIQDDSQGCSNHFSSVGYECDMCPAGSVKFITETDVEIHRKRDHCKEIYKLRSEHKERFCTVCMKLLPNYSSLITHLKTEHLLSSPSAKRIEREIYICDYCNNIFFNKDILAIHIEFRHLYDRDQRKNKYFTCPNCARRSCIMNVWFHFRQHDIPSIAVCEICISSFPDRQQLQEHLKTHPVLYRCDTCLYTTNKESLYNSHLDKHESRTVNSKRKMDKSIKKIFRTKKDSELIKFNIHNSLKGLYLPSIVHICTLCREICTDKVDMNTHVLRDHMFREAAVKVSYVCLCGDEFSNKILLKQHVFKLKGGHRVLEEGEDINPEIKNPKEDTLHTKYMDEQPVLIIEALDDYGSIAHDGNMTMSVDIQTDGNNQEIPTDNYLLSTNKDAENTAVTITRITDEHTDNNITLSTENAGEDGVIVITRMVD